MLVDITKDVTAAKYEYEYKEPEKIERQVNTITEEALEEAAALIRQAKRPYIFVGGGAVISGASDEVRELAHKLQVPVCDSLM